MTCNHCNHENPPEAVFCSMCGNVLSQSSTSPAPDPVPHSPGLPQYREDLGRRHLKKRMAIASLVIGIVSILTLSCGLVGAIPGIVFGIMAHSKATKQPLEYGGKGIALAGIITSVTSIPLGAILGIVAAIVVPRYMKPVEIASETSIIIRLEEISLAEYKLYDKTHRYGTLQDLEAAGLLDSSAPVPVGYKVAVRT